MSIDPAEAHRRVQSGEPAAIRFRTPENREVVFRDLVRGEIRFHTDVIGDQILLRSDGFPAYNFAVVVDDGLMGVTHVVRGEDHISNTPRQILIYEALGFTPPDFGHVAMVLGPDHTKLSKRHGAVSVDEFREKGYLPEALLNYLALLSWSPGEDEEIVPIAEMAKRFSLSDVGHSASVFDEEKLAWVNRHYLKEADPDRLANLSVPHLERAGYISTPVDAEGLAYLASITPVFSTSVDRLDQVPQRLRQLFEFSPQSAVAQPEIRSEIEAGAARGVIAALADELESTPRLLDRQVFRSVADRVRQRTGQKGRALFHPIRIALTAAGDGPELDLLVPAIDRAAGLSPSSGLAPIVGCRERAQNFMSVLG
jgi:glutamyl-tRNA synthetase